jgi:hypothetical protein
MAISIPLPNKEGEIVAYATVDDEDAELADLRWYRGTKSYVMRYLTDMRYDRLHWAVLRRVAGDPDLCFSRSGIQGDHINGDRLDCRRSNLRLVTPAQNGQNRKPRAGSLSGLRGVSWCKRNQKWAGRGFVAGKGYHLGYFEDKQEAAQVVQAWRLEHFPFTNEERTPWAA